MRQIKNMAGALALLGVLAACSDDATPPEAASVPDCQIVGFNHDVLTAGCWAIQIRGLSDSPLAQLELPTGFSGNDAWVWRNGEREDEWGAINLLQASDVYRDACARVGKPAKVGPSVMDFASALAAQKSISATTPVPVSLDGHDGVYLELTAPAGVDLSRCRGKELVSWQTGEETGGAAPGYVNRYWVLDVDGQRVVLLASTSTGATETTVATFTGIAEGATFADG